MHLRHFPQLRWLALGCFATLASVCLAADTDSDGLDDAVETNTGTFVSASNTGTNPNAADSDGDGVPDGLEVRERTSPVNGTAFHSFSRGMTAFYPFDGALTDESGNNRSGSVHGNYQVKDDGLFLIGDQSLYYAGGGWFKPSAIGLDSSSFTLSVWVTGITTGGVHPEEHVLNIGAFHSPNGIISFSFMGEGSNFRSFAGNNLGDPINHATNTFSNHVIISKNNLNVKFFINGELVRFVDLTNDLNVFANSEFFSINRHWWDAGAGSSARSSGVYSNLRLYNRALSNEEVQKLSESEAPKLPRLSMPRFSIVQGSYVSSPENGTFLN
jgi:Concanavalin A-like lectin/glucanases superfamily